MIMKKYKNNIEYYVYKLEIKINFNLTSI